MATKGYWCGGGEKTVRSRVQHMALFLWRYLPSNSVPGTGQIPDGLGKTVSVGVINSPAIRCASQDDSSI